MTSSNASCSPRPTTPIKQTIVASGSPSPKKSPRPSPSSRGSSPRNPVNTAWTQAQERRIFVDHLRRWAANHDSSPYFNGRISLVPQIDSSEKIALGKSIKCVLTDSFWTDAAKKPIVIRLFPPRGRDERYKLVVRCGAGWMSARDFFNRQNLIVEYLQAKNDSRKKDSGDSSGQTTLSIPPWSRRLGPKPADRDTVIVRPLFLPFLRLPLELQQMILGIAAGLTGTYRPCRDRTAEFPPHHIHRRYYPKQAGVITLSTIFKISKALNDHLIPWVFHTTDFRFELTGFTNFLWTCGPLRRAELRRITFKFGSVALLHCLRWLALDQIFELFGPTVYTNPYALQFLWRCQIQDLAREVHLAILTIDIQHMPAADIPMIVRILRLAFGSVDHVRFKSGAVDVSRDDKRLAGLKEKRSWRELCKGWFERSKRISNAMSDERRAKSVEDLESDMDKDKDFFDSIADNV